MSQFREFVDKLVDIMETPRLTFSEIKQLKLNVSNSDIFEIAFENGEEWVIIHNGVLEDEAYTYLDEQADAAQDEALEILETHMKKYCSFNQDRYKKDVIKGGYEYIFAHYDHKHHKIQRWNLFRQG